jgi:glyoxylase-like metal-dependent hydrolase (beta-lactamase superfamily II)
MTEYQAPPAEMKNLAEGVYVYLQPFVFYSSNAGLIVDREEAVVVDSLTNRYMVENFLTRIREITGKPIRFLINTHPHGDHTYTNQFFEGAKVICSSECRKETINTPPDQINYVKKEVPAMSFEGARDTPQDITFENSLTLYLEEREVHLVCLGPGHSPSDTYVFLPREKIVFCGDMVFSGTPPLSLAGSVIGHIRQLETLAALEAEIYVAGHGPVVGKEYVCASRDYLRHLLDEARKCFDQGMPLQEAARIMPGDQKRWPAMPSFFPVAQCARAYHEFSGGEPGSPLKVNLVELMKSS